MSGCLGVNPGSGPSLADPLSFPHVQNFHSSSLDHPYTLAVLPLENLSPSHKLDWLGNSLAEMLANDLANWPSLSVVARKSLGPVLREQWLQHRGFSPTIPPVDLGHIQGARYLVRGGFYEHEENFRVNLQVIDVETGVIVRALSAEGGYSEIPRIEQDLVVQILKLFNAPLDSTETEIPDLLEEELLKRDSLGQDDEKNGLQVNGTDSFSVNSVHQIDLQLSLERMTQYRMDAYRLAEKIWQKGWFSEIGQPLYRFLQSSENTKESLPLLILPISLFMEQNKIAEILKDWEEADVHPLAHLESDGFSRGQTNDSGGTSQLFFRHVLHPRRIFVRALNEQGELMAVYSKWSWQTERILHDSSHERIFFPMWPQPLLSNMAEFPLSWVERGEQHVTFDLVVVPIPEELLTIVLEPVIPSEIEAPNERMQTSEEAAFLMSLEKWIRMKWKPPVADAFPVEGYLPANKRTVGALLQLQEGKIMKVQFHDIPQDPLFARSLEELKSDLLAYCGQCQKAGTFSSSPTLQAIRLQLTLLKDLRAFRFGSRPY